MAGGTSFTGGYVYLRGCYSGRSYDDYAAETFGSSESSMSGTACKRDCPIMTENDGGVWRQTIFYPFLHMSLYGRGIALQSLVSTTRHDTINHCDVTDIESIAVYNESKQEVTIFAVNRNVTEDISFEADLRNFLDYQIKEYLVLEQEDTKVTNGYQREAVKPAVKQEFQMEDGRFETVMKKCSWNVIRFGK